MKLVTGVNSTRVDGLWSRRSHPSYVLYRFRNVCPSPPLWKNYPINSHVRFYCLYVFLKNNIGISGVFFSMGGKGQTFRIQAIGGSERDLDPFCHKSRGQDFGARFLSGKTNLAQKWPLWQKANFFGVRFFIHKCSIYIERFPHHPTPTSVLLIIVTRHVWHSCRVSSLRKKASRERRWRQRTSFDDLSKLWMCITSWSSTLISFHCGLGEIVLVCRYIRT